MKRGIFNVDWRKMSFNTKVKIIKGIIKQIVIMAKPYTLNSL